MVDPLSLPYDDALQRGILVFHRKGTGSGITSVADPILSALVQSDASSALPVYLNMPTVNFYLAFEADAAKSDITAYNVCDEFAMMGPMISIMGANGSDGNPSVIGGFGKMGPEHVFNVWGDQLPTMTPLFLLIKMVERPDVYVLDPTGRAYDRPDIGSTTKKRRCMQIIPWADPLRLIPNENDVKYIDNHGNLCFGAAIRVGSVQHYVGRSQAMGPYSRGECAFNMQRTVQCDKMYMFCETPRVSFFG
jgi:hypothetical protein